MSLKTILNRLEDFPVIAASREKEALARAGEADAGIVFALGGDVLELAGQVRRLQEAGKKVFVHIDLVDGVSRNPAGVRLIARHIRPDGLITTRSPLIRVAAEEGMHTILRMFLLDSASLGSGIKMVRECRPDMVEVMPGLLPEAIAQFKAAIPQPIIAGGMIVRKDHIYAALAAGALAVSTSCEALWRE